MSHFNQQMMLRQAVLDEAERCIGLGYGCCQDAAPGLDLTKLSWCQIFWLHCLRAADLTDKVWQDIDADDGWVSSWLPSTDHPLMGDLIYIAKPNQHGAVFKRVGEDGRILSVDGNSLGHIVQPRARERHEISAFFSIQPVVEAWVPKEYR
jgi:hypothetical protein